MKFIAFLILFVSCSGAYAQADKTSDLYKSIIAQDSLLFNVGFNQCDISQFERLISDDFEFFHDEAGFTGTKDTFILSISEGLCKLPYKPRRELDANTMEVYPLKKKGVLYGAIQNGTHLFYATEQGKPEYLTSTGKFTHIWLLDGEKWKLQRALSFDHRRIPH